MAQMVVSGADLRAGDVILHPIKDGYRRVYEVVEQPSVSPGAWSLRCKVQRLTIGGVTEITIPPTAPFTIDRKESV